MDKVAIALKSYIPFDLYTSDTIRILESARIISDRTRIPVNSITGMEERNWGIYSGKPWKAVKEILDKFSLVERYNFVPENGESWKQCEGRLINSLKKILLASKKTS